MKQKYKFQYTKQAAALAQKEVSQGLHKSIVKVEDTDQLPYGYLEYCEESGNDNHR